MAPIALYNYIATDQLKGSDLKGSVVLLDIGADNTDLIITDGTRIWQRNVPIGGNHFTRALTKELKLTFAKAEHLKRNATKAPDPKAVFTAMRGVFNDFASEINRSIGFYSIDQQDVEGRQGRSAWATGSSCRGSRSSSSRTSTGWTSSGSTASSG